MIRFLLGLVAGLVTGILLFGSLLDPPEDEAQPKG
jgi:hypothetical protein